MILTPTKIENLIAERERDFAELKTTAEKYGEDHEKTESLKQVIQEKYWAE